MTTYSLILVFTVFTLMIQPLIVNGERLLVRENLWQFLKQIRSQLAAILPLLTWCDMISIDQSSTDEKNHQVKMMGDIYRNATMVVAWLGRETTGSNKLFKSINKHLEMYTELDITVIVTQVLMDTGMQSGVVSVLNRSYWNRMWIVQEFLICEKVTLFCGNIHVGNAAIRVLHDISEALREASFNKFPRRIAHDLISSRLRPRVDWTGITDLMAAHGSRACAVPHDHVYALLALATESKNRPESIVDYSCSAEELLINVMKLHFFQGGMRRSKFRVEAAETLFRAFGQQLRHFWFYDLEYNMSLGPYHYYSKVVKDQDQAEKYRSWRRPDPYEGGFWPKEPKRGAALPS